MIFMQSDFGCIFKFNNSSGIDYVWGNYYFVLGGVVKGGFYGVYLMLVLGGLDDVGVDSWEQQGCWIFISLVDQYVVMLFVWMGVSDGQFDVILFNFVNFGSVCGLGFV